ncbi:tight junction protein ZO-3 [Puma concolor]|uniref:Tight junction protein ZO-3 n=1 Tax=Puma concolor TaxID=9696 RepID=A0A6P6H8S0_PUMCO|nr:tight junction protein ZO-3 [Puma concolor]
MSGSFYKQTVKRPRKIQLPAKASPSGGHQVSDGEADHGQGYDGDTSSGSGRSWGERSRRQRTGRRSRAGSHGRRSPGGRSEANGLALVSGFKRLPRQDVQMRPVKSVLVRRRDSEGEVLDMEEMTIWEQHTATLCKDPRRGFGIAISGSRDRPSGSVVVSDVINGVSSENLSLSDTRRLIEKSEGKLTLLVLRDRGQFLVNIPPAVSDSDSSLLDDISDLGSETSQAPPSHVPPPPQHVRRSSDASWTDSPEESPPLWRDNSVDSTTISETGSARQSSYDIYRVPSGQSKEDRGYVPPGKRAPSAGHSRIPGLRPRVGGAAMRGSSFKRPVVILGPVADIAMQKLTAEMPDQFEIADSVSRTDSPSKIIKLDTVRVIAENNKHALLDVTPSAVERLNYVQYYPIVVFLRLEPDNSSEGNLDLPHRGLADSSADLSCDSRVNSDYETDGEGYTDGEGGPHTDVDEGPPAPALARSSEPVLADEPQSPGDHGRAPGPRGTQVDGHSPHGQWRQDSMRTYGQEALKKKFTRARDMESSDEDGYDWGPATDL